MIQNEIHLPIKNVITSSAHVLQFLKITVLINVILCNKHLYSITFSKFILSLTQFHGEYICNISTHIFEITYILP